MDPSTRIDALEKKVDELEKRQIAQEKVLKATYNKFRTDSRMLLKGLDQATFDVMEALETLAHFK